MSIDVKWDTRFYELAKTAREWVKGNYTPVGACVVHPNRRSLSLGYCGLPRGVKDRPGRLKQPDIRRGMSLHAEVNAILNAGMSVEGWTLYCTTFPCSHCAAAIIQSGIVRVVAPKWDRNKDELWLYTFSEHMFGEAGMEITYLEERDA